MPLLTPEEKALPPKERRALRKQRRLEKWPDTDGRPPWVLHAGEVLKAIALEAVRFAAQTVVGAGREKHDVAVARVLDRMGVNGKAGELVTNLASEAVWDAFESMEGEIDE